MVTDEQTDRYLAAIRKAGNDLGLSKEDQAGLLVGAAHAAMESTFGLQMAARQMYWLALELWKKAGLEESPNNTTRH